jgi:hypothetical protein
MPFSWVKAPSGTSPKIRACTGGDPSKLKFEECVESIVAKAGGRVESLWFEQNGKFAHIHIYWETHEQRANIVFDLQAEDVIDLISPREVDELAAAREAAD